MTTFQLAVTRTGVLSPRCPLRADRIAIGNWRGSVCHQKLLKKKKKKNNPAAGAKKELEAGRIAQAQATNRALLKGSWPRRIMGRLAADPGPLHILLALPLPADLVVESWTGR